VTQFLAIDEGMLDRYTSTVTNTGLFPHYVLVSQSVHLEKRSS